MAEGPITITEDTSIDKALKLMQNQKIRRLPVLNKRGKLVGIVSEKDLLYVSPLTKQYGSNLVKDEILATWLSLRELLTQRRHML